MKKWIDLLKKTYQEWSDDNCLQIGAALSFYTLGSLVPLLLVITSIFTYIAVGTESGQSYTDQIIGYIGSNVGQQTADAINEAITARSEDLQQGSIISAIIGFVSLLFTASGVFGQLDTAFDVIWNVPDDEKPSGIWGTIRSKLFSFGLVLAVAFVLLVSTVLTSLINTFTDLLAQYVPGGGIVVPIINIAVQLAIISFVFMLLFKYLPSTRVEWRDVAVGGVLTGVLWIIGQQLLSIYFGTGSFSSYGVIGGVLAFLVYVYYSSQIVFFGGEFTQVYARTHGSRAAENTAPQGITPAGALMVGTATVAKQREVDRAREQLSAQRAKQVAAATTGGIIGLIGGALIGGAGLVIGLVRGATRLRRM